MSHKTKKMTLDEWDNLEHLLQNYPKHNLWEWVL